MSVHVFLQPASTTSNESVRGTSPVIANLSFSQAFSHATAASAAAATQRSADSGGDQKQKRAGHCDKEGSSDSEVGPAVVPPVNTMPLQPVSPIPSLPVQADEEAQPALSATGRAESTIAPQSLKSDESTAVGVSAAAPPDAVDGVSQLSGATASDVKDANATDGSATDASAPDAASGDLPAKSDATSSIAAQIQVSPSSVPPPTIDPSLLLSNLPVGNSASQDLSSLQSGGELPQQTVAAPGDVAQASATVLPDGNGLVAASQGSANVPAGMDVSLATSAGKDSGAASDETSGHPRATNAVAKDRFTEETRSQKKTVAAGDLSPTETTPGLLLVKVAETSGASSHQGDPGQRRDTDGSVTQILQPTAAQPTVLVHDAPNASAPAASDGAAHSPASVATGSVDSPLPPGINGARLIQSIHQSEMKLGMNSAEFGNISISTSVTHQVLSAQISLDHAELGRALIAHLPAMEQKLGDAYGLQTRLEVRGGTGSSTPDSAPQSGGGRQDGRSPSGKPASYASGQQLSGTRTTLGLVAESSRLDIRI